MKRTEEGRRKKEEEGGPRDPFLLPPSSFPAGRGWE